MVTPLNTSDKNAGKSAKVAFIFDDRLSHDRKVLFARTVTILRSHFSFDILPAQISEDELISHLEKNEYALVLIPWYKYIGWKKVENFFGSLRLSGPTVAGYFADSVLPFEFSTIPNYHRMIFLDFYRLETTEIEMLIRALTQPQERSGFQGSYFKNTTVHYADWLEHDGLSTRCIDTALKVPLLQHMSWIHRLPTLRFFLTALWSICFQEKRSYGSLTPYAQLELLEVNKHIVIKLMFESKSLTLKTIMDSLWPNGDRRNASMNEISRYADFLRFQMFPETHQIEITAFFSPHAPSIEYPGEVRGFWIEPLKAKFIKPVEDNVGKRVPIQAVRSDQIAENLKVAGDLLRFSLHQLQDPGKTSPQHMETLITQIKAITYEIEKIAEKKKIA